MEIYFDDFMTPSSAHQHSDLMGQLANHTRTRQFPIIFYKNKIAMLEFFYCQWDHMAHLGMFSLAPSWM